MTPTLIALIDNADANGTVSFSFTSQYIKAAKPDLSPKKLTACRQLLESHFYRMSLLTLKLSRLKRWTRDVVISHTVDVTGTWHIDVNLAKLMLLPAENPTAELQELRSLFETMKEFLESSEAASDIQFCNNRNGRSAVYGTAHCRLEGADSMELDAAYTARLTEQIEKSPVLQFFLRSTAKGLQKIGPWSWLTIDKRQLYENRLW